MCPGSQGHLKAQKDAVQTDGLCAEGEVAADAEPGPWLLRMSKAGPKPALSGKQLCRTEARSSICPSVRLSQAGP